MQRLLYFDHPHLEGGGGVVVHHPHGMEVVGGGNGLRALP